MSTIAPAKATAPKKVRINAELSPDVAQELVDMAKATGVSLSEVIRRSINTEAFLQKKRSAGGKVLIDEGSGVLKELVFLR
jgi:hypothetical protein